MLHGSKGIAVLLITALHWVQKFKYAKSENVVNLPRGPKQRNFAYEISKS